MSAFELHSFSHWGDFLSIPVPQTEQEVRGHLSKGSYDSRQLSQLEDFHFLFVLVTTQNVEIFLIFSPGTMASWPNIMHLPSWDADSHKNLARVLTITLLTLQSNPVQLVYMDLHLKKTGVV